MRVIGISPAHDSSVAVICDGKLEKFYKEERFTRKKRDNKPINCIHKVFCDYKKGEVDAVVMASPTADAYADTELDLVAKFFDCQSYNMNSAHHLAHASLAFNNSGFDKASVFVIDRNGSYLNKFEREAETIFDYEHGAVEIFYRNTSHESKNKNTAGIVKVYETATKLINQPILENGKTMGLAAYGKDSDEDLFFKDGNVDQDLFFFDSYGIDLICTNKKYFGKETTEVTKDNYQFYADYAYQVQKQTQERIAELIQFSIDETWDHNKNICITGGYGLNVVANSYFVNKFPDVNFYFEPLADDSGNSIGAALYIYKKLTDDPNSYPIDTTFFHGDKYSVSDIDGDDTSVEEIVSLLINNKSIGIFQGYSEAGPRSLGNRSILFDARNPEAKDIINRIKKREWYRPFACMVLEEDASEYFNMMGLKSSPFMTISFKCKKPDSIPGVVHVDGSCRIQTVSEKDGVIFHLLKKFKEQTGISVLLNTSLNLAGDPLAETPEDALNVLKNSELDCMWFPESGKLAK